MYKLALLFFVGAAAAQQFACPKEDGFYTDNNQCDKYYDCYRGTLTEKLCPDGLVFDYTLAPKVEQCNYPFIVECAEGSQLQQPQPSGIECPRQNGYFEHEDPTDCLHYYQCTGGIAASLKCATGLVFDEFTGSCQWAHAGFRTGCALKTEVLSGGFFCPNATQLQNGQQLDHARYVHEEDCRKFYICLEGRDPMEGGCPYGTVFNDVTLNCDEPLNVPGCENYYPPENKNDNKLQF